jgi:hypothetical protein
MHMLKKWKLKSTQKWLWYGLMKIWLCNQKEGRLPKVDRDRHRESSHLPDFSETFAQTEHARTFTPQWPNTANELCPSFYVESPTTAAKINHAEPLQMLYERHRVHLTYQNPWFCISHKIPDNTSSHTSFLPKEKKITISVALVLPLRPSTIRSRSEISLVTNRSGRRVTSKKFSKLMSILQPLWSVPLITFLLPFWVHWLPP